MSLLVEIDSASSLENLFSNNGSKDDNNNYDDTMATKTAVLLFGTDWHESIPTLKMVLNSLAQQNPSLAFGYIDAENLAEISDKFEVTMVPTIVLMNVDKAKQPIVLERLEGGVEPSQVTVAVQRLLNAPESFASTISDYQSTKPSDNSSNKQSSQETLLNERLKQLINSDTVVLFMKGDPSQPRCGFSRQAVEILEEQKIPFSSFDILADETVRHGLKKYSDWPTYPQIYVKGELIGGLDILKEMASEEGSSLKEQWEIDDNALPTKESSHSRLEKLVKRQKVMLFMKGLPSAPQCGFSRQIVELLDETGVSYDAFNILEDNEVRQGLKEFSDWPTYPQLYVQGELIGGLDIVKELKESGDLEDILKA